MATMESLSDTVAAMHAEVTQLVQERAAIHTQLQQQQQQQQQQEQLQQQQVISQGRQAAKDAHDLLQQDQHAHIHPSIASLTAEIGKLIARMDLLKIRGVAPFFEQCRLRKKDGN